MTRQELYERLNNGPVILDGATGSNLVKAGMPAGVCPELWILDHPDVMLSLQKAYVDAGTDILYAPTFSGNRIKLSEYGARDQVGSINEALVRLAKEAAGDRALVAGDLTMTGQTLEPVGNLSLEELISVYKEQVEALLFAEPVGTRYFGRVVAAEGDVVNISDTGSLIVNGTTQGGEILFPTERRENDGMEYPLRVPEGCVYVLGDYRTNTRDSRDFGPIPLESVEGKVITILRRRGL